MTYQEKRRLVEQLLDHWRDYFDPASNGQPSHGDGEPLGIALLSSMARHPSVVELSRILELCRRMAPGHYKHLAGWYGAEWRVVRALETDSRGRTKLHPVTGRPLTDPDPKKMRRERVVPSWVVWRMVDRALDFVCCAWDSGVPLELPLALNRKLRPLADADGWTEAA